MSTTTSNLGLFKYDINTDTNVPFSITDALNNNWDILDEKVNGKADKTTVETSLSEKVSKSGDIMTGPLTLLSNTWGSLLFQNTNIDVSSKPSVAQYAGLDFRDKNNNRIGFFGVKQGTDGTTKMEIQRQLSTCIATDPSDLPNSIVTTTGIAKASNGYVKFGNGIILQWGTAANVANGSSISLNRAFSNTKYKIATCPTGRTATSAVTTNFNEVPYALTTTNFKIAASNPMAAMDWIAIGY